MRIASYFLAVVLLLVCRLAAAQSQAVALTYGTAGGTLAGGAITTASPSDFTRLIQGGTVLGDVAIRDAAKARVGSVDVDMVLQRRMPWLQVARGAAAIGRTIPYVATGVAFIELMDSLRLRSNGSTWSQDPGTDRTTESVTDFQCFGPALMARGTVLSAATACLAAAITAPDRQSWVNSVSCVSQQNGTQFSCTRLRQTCQVNTVTGALSSCTTQDMQVDVYPRTQTLTQCPASVDALNPANSLPAGLPVGYDGKCRTGRYTDAKTETQAGDIANANASKAAAAAAVASMLGRGVDLAPRTDTPTASGPASVAQPGTTTTTTGPNGTTTGSSAPTAIIVYNGPSYTWNDSTVVTTSGPNGPTTTTTTAPPLASVETCGLPGKPACKIDETGTPPMPPVVDPTVGQIADDAARRTAADAQLTDPAFGWFSAPPVVTCTPFEWPGGFSLNPCGPMEIVRSIMAYLWAIFAAWWSFGMVRRTIAGS